MRPFSRRLLHFIATSFLLLGFGISGAAAGIAHAADNPGTLSLGGPFAARFYAVVPPYSQFFIPPPAHSLVAAQTFSVLDFDPETPYTPSACAGAPYRTAFTDYIPSGAGCTLEQANVPAGKCGQFSGVTCFFEGTFTNTITVSQAGTYTMYMHNDDGALLGFGPAAGCTGGAAACTPTGALCNPKQPTSCLAGFVICGPAAQGLCPATTYEKHFPVTTGYDACCLTTYGAVVSLVKLTFPTAGTYPVEIDYAQGWGSNILTLDWPVDGQPLTVAPPAQLHPGTASGGGALGGGTGDSNSPNFFDAGFACTRTTSGSLNCVGGLSSQIAGVADIAFAVTSGGFTPDPSCTATVACQYGTATFTGKGEYAPACSTVPCPPPGLRYGTYTLTVTRKPGDSYATFAFRGSGGAFTDSNCVCGLTVNP